MGPYTDTDAYRNPQDEDAHPPTQIAADGETTLKRFRIEGVIYAPTIGDAQRTLDQADIYVTAVRVTDDPVPVLGVKDMSADPRTADLLEARLRRGETTPEKLEAALNRAERR